MATSKKKEVVDPTVLETYQGSKQERLQQLYNKWFGCTRCNLGELRTATRPPECNAEIVFGDGNPDSPILIVGEGPGEMEEATSIPFMGKSGQLLNQLFAVTTVDQEVHNRYVEYCNVSHGVRNQKKIDEFHDFMLEWRRNEFFITNVVACRPPENATPVKTQIEACWERLRNIIYIVDPMLIIAAGNSALAAVMRKASTKITAMRGKLYDVEFPGRVGPVTYPVIPIFHPSYLLRTADFRMKGGDWEKTVDDFKKALRVVDLLKQQHFGVPAPRRE